MKNLKFLLPIFMLCAASVAHAAPTPAAANELYVQVRDTKLRSGPLMWAGTVATLAYGDKLTVSDTATADRGWFKVKTAKGASGFVHQSAVSLKKIVLSGKGSVTGTEADPTEVILAGKGFSKQVEQEFAKARGLDFTAVNKVEQIQTNGGQLQAFIRDGQLKGAK